MALTACEITWLVSLLKDMGLKDLETTYLNCDNQAAIFITANLVFHERTKHIEVDCHFVRDKVQEALIKPVHVSTKNQVVDVLTKVLTV